MLGTVVRPYRKGKEADFDVDLVSKIQEGQNNTSPQEVKNIVGAALNNPPYNQIIDEEGKRCWTLNYKEEDGVGFHVDCLPCVHATPIMGTKIALTHKEGENNYDWKHSDPRALDTWFKNRQQVAFEQLKDVVKQRIFESKGSVVYNSIDEIPDRRVKTPLQKVIQILKRHRDIYFAGKNNEDDKPISMVITILSAHLYKQESDSFEALKNIVKSLNEHSSLLVNQRILNEELALVGLISFDGNIWRIANPILQEENFAEYWHKNNHAKARAFFDWVSQLEKDLLGSIQTRNIDILRPMLKNSLGQKLNVEFLKSLGLTSESKSENIIVPRKHVEVTNPIKPHCLANEKQTN